MSNNLKGIALIITLLLLSGCGASTKNKLDISGQNLIYSYAAYNLVDIETLQEITTGNINDIQQNAYSFEPKTDYYTFGDSANNNFVIIYKNQIIYETDNLTGIFPYYCDTSSCFFVEINYETENEYLLEVKGNKVIKQSDFTKSINNVNQVYYNDGNIYSSIYNNQKLKDEFYVNDQLVDTQAAINRIYEFKGQICYFIDNIDNCDNFDDSVIKIIRAKDNYITLSQNLSYKMYDSNLNLLEEGPDFVSFEVLKNGEVRIITG